jgi:hypothetical protein
MEVEDKLAQQIYQLIEHFKQDDPVGLPLVPLPDPTVSLRLVFWKIKSNQLVSRMLMTSGRVLQWRICT